MEQPFWHKFVSRRFLVALLALAATVGALFLGMDEVAIQEGGAKLIGLIVAIAGIYIGGESAVDVARNLKK